MSKALLPSYVPPSQRSQWSPCFFLVFFSLRPWSVLRFYSPPCGAKHSAGAEDSGWTRLFRLYSLIHTATYWYEIHGDVIHLFLFCSLEKNDILILRTIHIQKTCYYLKLQQQFLLPWIEDRIVCHLQRAGSAYRRRELEVRCHLHPEWSLILTLLPSPKYKIY